MRPLEEEEVDETMDDMEDEEEGMKLGEEKEIGKQGLKKKLLKEGEGWERPETGDEVEGIDRLQLPHLISVSLKSK